MVARLPPPAASSLLQPINQRSLALPAREARAPQRQGGWGGRKPARAAPSLVAPAPDEAAQQRGVSLAVAVSVFPPVSLGSSPQDPPLCAFRGAWLAGSVSAGGKRAHCRAALCPSLELGHATAPAAGSPETEDRGALASPPPLLPSRLAAGAAQLGRGRVCVRKMWAAGADLRGRATGIASRRPPWPPVSASIARALKRGRAQTTFALPSDAAQRFCFDPKCGDDQRHLPVLAIRDAPLGRGSEEPRLSSVVGAAEAGMLSEGLYGRLLATAAAAATRSCYRQASGAALSSRVAGEGRGAGGAA